MSTDHVIKAYDCDSHVEESELTFSDRYWDQRYRGRRPVVRATDSMGGLSFIVDSISHPRLVGPSPVTGAIPVSHQGEPSPFFKRRTAAALEHGHIDTLESCELHSAKARVDQMDREGQAVQVNFPTMLLTWPVAHDPKIGCAVARSYNNWMGDMSGQVPDRLKWVTVIDPADIRESVREMERTKEMGSSGLMLLGMVGNKHLDDPTMEPIWATAAELDMPVAVHPGFCNTALEEVYQTISDAVIMSFVFTELLGYYAIMRSGLLDRYPKLRVGFMENGARWVDYLTMRIEENCGRLAQRTTGTGVRPKIPEADIAGSSGFGRPNAYKSELLPSEYIRSGRVFVNCEVDEDQLPFVVKQYGSDFLLFASDVPHGHRVVDPVGKMLARADLSDETKRKILVDNVAKFYGLPVPEPAAEPQPAPAGD